MIVTPIRKSREQTRNQICFFLRGKVINGRLMKGSAKEAANLFSYSLRGIESIWKRHRDAILDPGTVVLDVQHRGRLSNVKFGRPRKYTIRELKDKVKNTPFRYRKTVRSCAFRTGIPRSTLHRLLTNGTLKKTRNVVKPKLTPENKNKRLEFCLSKVSDDDCFDDNLARVHIDEKWFNVDQIKTGFIIVPDEEEPPDRRVRHKSHIEKAMCITAIARPRKNVVTGEWWDGKIGTWFFVKQVPAERRSRYRPAGTLEPKNVSVNKNTFAAMLVDNVIPAIEAKWPTWWPKRVRIQQDNAPCHPAPGKHPLLNAKMEEQMVGRGWDMNFECQPANSPDLNVLDLAFFRAIAAIQQQNPTKNVNELMAAVQSAFQELPLDTCKKVWTTLQMVYNEVIRHNGDNNYKLPHAGKDKVIMQLTREIPDRLPCQAKLTGGTIDGEVIVAFMTGVTVIPPAPIPPLPPPAMLIVEEAPLADTDVVEWGAADEENESVLAEGDADSGEVTAHYCRVRNVLESVGFWDNFDEMIEWGGDDYENHSCGEVADVDDSCGEVADVDGRE